MSGRRFVAAATVLALPLLGLAATEASSAPPDSSRATPAAKRAAPMSDTKEATDKPLRVKGTRVKVPSSYQGSARTGPRARLLAETPPVGARRCRHRLQGRDQVAGILYRKDYILRGAGEQIEVWVAVDTSFPAGDCRNAVPNTTTVTDAQVADLHPRVRHQHVPEGVGSLQRPAEPGRQQRAARPGRQRQRRRLHRRRRQDGHAGRQRPGRQLLRLPGQPDLHRGLLLHAVQRAVRPQRHDDRRVRLGAPHRCQPGDAPTSDLCTSRPARPRLYEGTFAHEYQHLLLSYVDPNETTWMNEGLADFAQTLTGYVDGTKTVYDKGGDSHLYCFQGYGRCRHRSTPTPATAVGPELAQPLG